MAKLFHSTNNIQTEKSIQQFEALEENATQLKKNCQKTNKFKVFLNQEDLFSGSSDQNLSIWERYNS